MVLDIQPMCRLNNDQELLDCSYRFEAHKCENDEQSTKNDNGAIISLLEHLGMAILRIKSSGH